MRGAQSEPQTAERENRSAQQVADRQQTSRKRAIKQQAQTFTRHLAGI